MDVQLTIVGQVVVDHQRHLLHVQPSPPDVRSYQYPVRPTPELAHNLLPLLLRHVTVHRTHREVGLAHLLCEPVDLGLGVAEDDGLCDGECVVQVGEGVELPLLALDGDEELLDALEGELITLDQHAEGVVHELAGHLEHLVRHGGRHEDHLSGWRQVPVDVVHLLLEPAVEHLVRLIQNQHLDPTSREVPLVDHVEHAARCPRHDVHTRLEGTDVVADRLAADAAVHLDVHVVAECEGHLLALLRQLARG
mmetsp:Transcript_34310/g.84975  ORF Transcript_34310/g.84975 Transcript_34310/m.84975 type:complete len:251 (-) Transcript_34310:420-1172(-)